MCQLVAGLELPGVGVEPPVTVSTPQLLCCARPWGSSLTPSSFSNSHPRVQNEVQPYNTFKVQAKQASDVLTSDIIMDERYRVSVADRILIDWLIGVMSQQPGRAFLKVLPTSCSSSALIVKQQY
jgi:hypothetical protein